MIIVLSPAKSLDYDTPPRIKTHTLPDFIARSAELIDVLRKLSPAQIGTLMKISDPLAVLNATRYGDWSTEFTAENSKQAALAFDGDVYGGLDANSLSADDLQFAQQHLRILSGLYGVLRPLDWMQPYRLEMGTRLAGLSSRTRSRPTSRTAWRTSAESRESRSLPRFGWRSTKRWSARSPPVRLPPSHGRHPECRRSGPALPAKRWN